MQREFLANLGLEKDTIDKIMAENGKDIAAEKQKAADLEGELISVKETLATANETIKGFKAKDLDVEEARKAAEDWEKKFRDSEKARAEDAKNNALMEALRQTNTRDADLLKACLDMDKLIYDEGKFIGLDDQIAAIRENKSYLFEDPTKPVIKGAHLSEPKDLDQGGEPPVDFAKMTYSQMMAYIEKHPEAAKLLEKH